MGRENLLEFFRDYFGSAAEYVVYDDGYRRWTYSYAQTMQAAQVFAGRLREAGIGKGDRVLLWTESRPEWLFAFWGSLLVGAVVVPFGSEASFEFVRRVQAIVQPRFIALGDDVSLNSDHSDLPACRLTAENWGQSPPEVVSPEIRASDLAEIVFTSGSTGEPKGVEITHGNLLSQVESVEPALAPYHRYLRLFFTPRLVQLLPLSHMFGQASTLELPPLITASIVITRQQSPAAIMELIRNRRVSAAFCVPRLLELLRAQIEQVAPEATGASQCRHSLFRRVWRYRRVRRFFGWRFLGFMLGGAPIDPELESFWTGLGYLVIEGYGLTEASPVVTLNHPLWPRRGSAGKPLPGVEVKIALDGEILVRGANVTPGYYQELGSTAELLQDGWLHTGDLGRLDAEGYLYISGRKKEMIVTPEGLNVFPDDVERVLDSLPGVRESAVIGVSAAGDGAREQVHAVVTLQPGADPRQILTDANRRLESHQRIRDISTWPESSLPRTPQTGKLRRGEIRDQILNSRSIELQRMPPKRSQEECKPDVVQEEIERRTRRKVTAETSMDELGLSSIDRVELLLQLERHCQRAIDEAEFASCRSVGELKERMERVLAAKEAGMGSRSEFPRWNRSRLSRLVRNANLALWILPLTRILARPSIAGLERLSAVRPPVIFAANHQSHLDTPLILGALPQRWRYRVAPAMFKEYFAAHFHAEQYAPLRRALSGFEYFLIALMFNAFPIPQQEAGVLDALRYAGDLVSDGWSLLIYPEGERKPSGQPGEFFPGVGLLATRLKLPVIPVHVEGVDRVLPRERIVPRPGRTRVTFGEPMYLHGEDPRPLAHDVEEAVKVL